MKKINDFIKENALLLLIPVIVACLFSYCVGANSKIEKGILEARIKQDKKYSEILSKLNSVRKDIEDQQVLLDELNTYKASKSEKEKELFDLQTDIASKTAEVNNLEKIISAKTEELNRLTRAITVAKSEKTLSAGVYAVGTDIEPGTYDVVLVSGSGNFFVHGRKNVNEIFGSDNKYYIKEYKNMTVTYGDEIKISGALKVKIILK